VGGKRKVNVHYKQGRKKVELREGAGEKANKRRMDQERPNALHTRKSREKKPVSHPSFSERGKRKGGMGFKTRAG